jgi:hypothetical protein
MALAWASDMEIFQRFLVLHCKMLVASRAKAPGLEHLALTLARPSA